MSGFDNDIMYSNNADFTTAGSTGGLESNGLITDGQMWIGSTALNVGGTHINVGSITSPLGTLSVGYSSPNITLDLAGGSTGIDSIHPDSGTDPVVPTALGLVNIVGTTVAAGTAPLTTVGSLNTLTITAQRSQALAAADSTKVGLCNFDSSSFSVDANGFVALTIPAGGFIWTDVTGATQALSVSNGYFTNRGAGVTYTLPATAALGDCIKIDGKLGITTIAQNANQSIRFSSLTSTVGVGGTLVGTNVGDCVTLRCSTAGASTVWVVENSMGNWNVN